MRSSCSSDPSVFRPVRPSACRLAPAAGASVTLPRRVHLPTTRTRRPRRGARRGLPPRCLPRLMWSSRLPATLDATHLLDERRVEPAISLRLHRPDQHAKLLRHGHQPLLVRVAAFGASDRSFRAVFFYRHDASFRGARAATGHRRPAVREVGNQWAGDEGFGNLFPRLSNQPGLAAHHFRREINVQCDCRDQRNQPGQLDHLQGPAGIDSLLPRCHRLCGGSDLRARRARGRCRRRRR